MAPWSRALSASDGRSRFALKAIGWSSAVTESSWAMTSISFSHAWICVSLTLNTSRSVESGSSTTRPMRPSTIASCPAVACRETEPSRHTVGIPSDRASMTQCAVLVPWSAAMPRTKVASIWTVRLGERFGVTMMAPSGSPGQICGVGETEQLV